MQPIFTMVDSLDPKKHEKSKGDFDSFCEQLEELKGKFPLHRLDEGWMTRFLRSLPSPQ
jgi:hypothetical protein